MVDTGRYNFMCVPGRCTTLAPGLIESISKIL
jgi:hypothetical protein